ncbi:MAG: SusD/RagB family nutrient-binding outer membrane lipoprotein [Draconibacterium sp.]|nr:SusD/RagB family nutrient-binding outer membrane lipoprotein [Draconibacterium sp.]
MKKIRIYLLLALFFTGVTGCTEWLDVNQNPNDLTTSTKDLVLAGATKQFAERQHTGSSFTLTGAWIGYFAHSGGWSGWNNVKSYNMTSSDYNNIFNQPYLNELKSLKFVKEQGVIDGNPAYVAVAKIMESALYQRLVDTYGDIPYFEAVQGFEQNTQPVYDDAQTIYNDLVIQLDSAILLLKAAEEATLAIESRFDVINGGDLVAWKQYANTLKLRVLLRQSEIGDLSGKMTFDEAGFITESITGNPGYIANQSGKMTPIYGYGKDYKGTLTSANQQYGLNIFLSTLYKASADPRLEICWEPGVESGDYSWATQLGNNAPPESHWNHSAVRMGPGIYGESDGDAMVMSIMEADFLIAEALARGYNLSSAGVSATAEEMFNKGIDDSFEYYGTRAGVEDIDAVLVTYRETLKGDAAWNSGNPVKSIMHQKYLAGVGVYHYETWADFRRTGYPDPLNPNEVDNSMISYFTNIVRAQVPVRMLYVQKELDINSENVKAAIDKTGVNYDSDFIMDARIFWDVN